MWLILSSYSKAADYLPPAEDVKALAEDEQ
jgi:hypothetical protein